jgi:anti-sigma B factor antagonist
MSPTQGPPDNLRPAGADHHTPSAMDDPSPFAIHVRPIHDHEVQVSVQGELDLVSASELEHALKRELLAGKDVVLDLSQIDFIDSTGLKAIVASVRMAKGVSRKLKLRPELPAHARRLMEIVGLLPFIPITPE